jgi:hypothetical protein
MFGNQASNAATKTSRASNSLSRAGVLSQLVQGVIDASSVSFNTIPASPLVTLNAASGGGQALVTAAQVPGGAILKGYRLEVLQTGGVGTVTQVGVFSAQNNLIINSAATPDNTGFDFVPLVNIAQPTSTVFLQNAGTPLTVDLSKVQTITRTVLEAQLYTSGPDGTQTLQFLGLVPSTAGITSTYQQTTTPPFAPAVGQSYVLALRGSGLSNKGSSIVLTATFDVYAPDTVVFPY